MGEIALSAPRTRIAGKNSRPASRKVKKNSRALREPIEGRNNQVAMALLSLRGALRLSRKTGKPLTLSRIVATISGARRMSADCSRQVSHKTCTFAKVFENTLQKRLIDSWTRAILAAGFLCEGTSTMKFGHFDDQNREYVITQPDTPLPWINYLGCQAYFGIISNTAGGDSRS